MKEMIKITHPKPFEEVGAEFVISGWVPQSWLETSYGSVENTLSLELIDIDGQTIMGTTLDLIFEKSWLSKYTNKLKFWTGFQFTSSNISFISKSQGRMTLKLSGHNDNCSLYIPIIVKNSNPKFKVDPKITKKHKIIEKMITQYEKDLLEYNKQWTEIYERRKLKNAITKDNEHLYHHTQDWEIFGGILDILEKVDNFNENYPLKQEDDEEKELEKKYKDAIEWRGPFCGGVFAVMNGYDFTLYSNDHDKHFHVIHRGKGINARISFPEIELINYKNAKNSIGNKELKKIIEFIKKPEVYNKLEEEFKKREQVVK